MYARFLSLTVKINKVKLIIEEDETFSDFADVEELAEELPSNSPRYVVVSYQLVSFPSTSLLYGIAGRRGSKRRRNELMSSPRPSPSLLL